MGIKFFLQNKLDQLSRCEGHGDRRLVLPEEKRVRGRLPDGRHGLLPGLRYFLLEWRGLREAEGRPAESVCRPRRQGEPLGDGADETGKEELQD